MEIRLLRYFLTIAEEQSVTKAAQRLHVTQPTLSRQIREFEQQLGVELFVRDSRKLELTPEGLFLRKRAQELIDFHDRIERVLRNNASNVVVGEVAIGAGEGQPMAFVSRCIAGFQKEYPQVRVNVVSNNASSVVKLLEQGAIDFAVSVQNVFDPERFDQLAIPGIDRWGALMRKDNPLATVESLYPDDLEGQPLIVQKEALDRGVIGPITSVKFENQNIVATFTLSVNAAVMVQAGVGIAVTFEGLEPSMAADDLVFRPFETEAGITSALIWDKHAKLSRPAQLFLEEAQSQMVERRAARRRP